MAVMAGALCLGGLSSAMAKEKEPPHKVTAQEVAEMLADPSATITYMNAAYRAYQNVGPENDMNQELRLNGAGFLKLPDNSSLFYRAYLPLYATEVIPPYELPTLPGGSGAVVDRLENPFRFDNEGCGDALLSAYWVPTAGELILGYGAALMVPTASEKYYGMEKWSAGPTLIAAKKVPGKYTVGGLLTHVWSFAGKDSRDGINMTTIQPAGTLFLNKKGTSLTVGSETTFNWDAEDEAWQVPVTVGLGQILPPIGKQFIGVAVAGSYYMEKPEMVQDWDVRAVVSVVFP